MFYWILGIALLAYTCAGIYVVDHYIRPKRFMQSGAQPSLPSNKKPPAVPGEQPPSRG